MRKRGDGHGNTARQPIVVSCMKDYGTPETPEDTPDPISAERGANDAARKAARTADDEAAERAMRPAQEGGAEGAGEQRLDSMKSATLLPPD